VSFKVTFRREGSGKKSGLSGPDSFAVNWITGYSGGTVSPLVTGSTFQSLKGGNITVR